MLLPRLWYNLKVNWSVNTFFITCLMWNNYSEWWFWKKAHSRLKQFWKHFLRFSLQNQMEGNTNWNNKTQCRIFSFFKVIHITVTIWCVLLFLLNMLSASALYKELFSAIFLCWALYRLLELNHFVGPLIVLELNNFKGFLTGLELNNFNGFLTSLELNNFDGFLQALNWITLLDLLSYTSNIVPFYVQRGLTKALWDYWLLFSRFFSFMGFCWISI